MLLAAGSNVHLKSDEGYTALDAAIHHKPPAIIALLQDHIAKQERAEAVVFVLGQPLGYKNYQIFVVKQKAQHREAASPVILPF